MKLVDCQCLFQRRALGTVIACQALGFGQIHPQRNSRRVRPRSRQKMPNCLARIARFQRHQAERVLRLGIPGIGAQGLSPQ